MARFRYLGEPEQTFILNMGPTLLIRCKRKDGTVVEFAPISPATEFPIDDDIGYDITEERTLRHLRADTRFEEIV